MEMYAGGLGLAPGEVDKLVGKRREGRQGRRRAAG